MNKMNPDNDLAFQTGEAVPDDLRGTRQGLFYLLSRSTDRAPYLLAGQADAGAPKEVAPARAPETPRAAALLARDDFKFNF